MQQPDFDRDLARASIDTIRLLAADMVEKAQSGHPGTPMEAAPIAYLLYTRHLRHSPADPEWPGRDRFVLSCGHASALLYSMLHLTGYALALDDLKNFRQLGSPTAGHPEFGHAPGLGIEVQVIDPWRQITYDQKAFDAEYLQAMGPLFTVAVGLAMRRVGDK